VTTRTPQTWALWAVRVATLLIPAGAIRRRYRQELASELWGMTWSHQLIHVLSMLLAAPALHRALVESGELVVPHSPTWCRLHLRHRWHIERTDDGSRYRRCLDCGMDNDETVSRRHGVGEGFGMSGVHPN